MQAFRWTSASGMVGLGDLAGGSFNSIAYGVSANGSTIVGSSNSASGFEAFIWDAANGMRSLQYVLVNDLGLDLTGWTLENATGVSADGLTIVGNGTNHSGDTEAWIATLCSPVDSLIAPNGGEAIIAGSTTTILWDSNIPDSNILLIEYSTNNGQDWNDVNTVANTGSYQWTLPVVNSDQSLVRISDANSCLFDESDNVFTIYQCTLRFDVTGDCNADFNDFAYFAAEWLQCGNPFNPNCLGYIGGPLNYDV